jgi:hypothetical protein
MDMSKIEFEKRMVEALKAHLKFEVEGGDFTDPNTRVVKVRFGYHEVAKFSFNVKEKEEYSDY